MTADDGAGLDAFRTLDLRVGRILEAAPLEGARKPAYALRVDLGPLGVRASSAQLTARYRAEELIGRQVIAAVNLGTRRIAGFVSEVLVLGVDDGAGGVVLLRPDVEVAVGERVY